MSAKSLREQLTEYQPEFTEIAQRADRGRVDTRYGRKIFDAELREPYEAAEKRMNGLLEQLFAQSAEIEFIKATNGVEIVTDEPSGLLITPTQEEINHYGTIIPIDHTDQSYDLEVGDGA
jgi:hypothetical protein